MAFASLLLLLLLKVCCSRTFISPFCSQVFS
jgi:hypothetical protein